MPDERETTTVTETDVGPMPGGIFEAADAPTPETVASEIAAVDGVAAVTVADGDDAPVVVAEVEMDPIKLVGDIVDEEMPRWMKYRIAHGLPIEDAPTEGDA